MDHRFESQLGHITFAEIVHEIISKAMLPLPLKRGLGSCHLVVKVCAEVLVTRLKACGGLWCSGKSSESRSRVGGFNPSECCGFEQDSLSKLLSTSFYPGSPARNTQTIRVYREREKER